MPPLTTRGDLIVQGATLPERLPGGGAGFYLQSQGAGAIPIYKQTMPPLTTQGDLITQGATIPIRVGIGDTGRVLKSRGPGFSPQWSSLFNLLTTRGDLWAQGVTAPTRIAAGLLDTYFKGQGAGELPIYEKMTLRDTGVHLGYSTRNASGDQVIAGVGFQPSVVLFFAIDIDGAAINRSLGFDDSTTHLNIILYNDGAAQALSSTLSLRIDKGPGNTLRGYISSMGSDGFTINWVLTGTCECRFIYLALP